MLDFALLRRSSISFFDIEKQETAVSRWSRARTKAAKVGKGLSKNEKARKLALQHWLEAVNVTIEIKLNSHMELGFVFIVLTCIDLRCRLIHDIDTGTIFISIMILGLNARAGSRSFTG